MKDVLSGEQLFPAGVSVNGEWGMAQGRRNVAAAQRLDIESRHAGFPGQ